MREQNMGQKEKMRQIQEFNYNKDRLYDALVRSTDEYLYIGNMKTGTFRYTRAMVEEFGLPGEIIPNAAEVWGEYIHPHDKAVFLESNQEVAAGITDTHNVEYRAINRFGQWVWLRCRGYLIRDEQGEPELFAGFIANMEKKNKVDHVTGIYNKYEFEDTVKKQMQERPDYPMGIMLLGLDDFKHINDLHDRMFGDEILRVTAQKIMSILPGNAGIYRMDGDEFAVLIQNLSENEFEELYEKIHEMFHHQQEYNGRKYYCTLSCGCAAYPGQAHSYLDLLKYAGYSLEASKIYGKNRMTVFSAEILKNKERALDITEQMRTSIENGFEGFMLCYQPQVQALNGQVAGAEALVRWQCPKYGMISPVEFIPLLEKSGLIIPAGKWIFREAVRQCKRWLKYRSDFVMSINLSYLQVLEPDFGSFIGQVLSEEQVSPANIQVELTETYLIKDQKTVETLLKPIQDMGIPIAMDDFGTGYSSLGVLKSTPVDLVKIDKAFVKGIMENAFDATVIRFIVALCHDVGKKVCLEGVETEQEYNIVKNSGLEYIQGFYFGRPVEAECFEKEFFID